jgi:hypothetical protein
MGRTRKRTLRRTIIRSRVRRRPIERVTVDRIITWIAASPSDRRVRSAARRTSLRTRSGWQCMPGDGAGVA